MAKPDVSETLPIGGDQISAVVVVRRSKGGLVQEIYVLYAILNSPIERPDKRFRYILYVRKREEAVADQRATPLGLLNVKSDELMAHSGFPQYLLRQGKLLDQFRA